ncbi:LacI family DNA-binding transcriptional regulator [Companilactobacillus allii]|uniref:Transcriptional regulator n=1 Tax=Companilactobacillus allii TaxID=1847728 RepID=A0A1P8Q1S3_9LACO|nr:LacI family DNA-binding transcriptional regulator [Companilactobacillus allii]APX71808.1 transcriptional regulator [Companilactobacillus allii]USQ68895.1 LacI family DNA-binding transcriptional regulator [Companilactobacillus allii]
MKKKQSANMKDVAALSQVSIATVSRFLNNDLSRMSEETAKRVKDAIDKLNYVPNSAARQMVTKSSKMIAVVVANIDDYFSTELFKGISSILESTGYIGVLFDTDTNQKREIQLMDSVNSQSFDGLIFQPLTSDMSLIENEIRREIPIVIVDREIELSPWPQVITNNYEAARNAMLKFQTKGYKHVIILSSEINIASTRRERYQGIKSVANNVDVIEISEKSHNHKDIHKEIVSLIKKSDEKTLIFAIKERWLLEFIPGLMTDGYIDDMNVTATGFSDTDLARAIEPKAELIEQNPFLMGASSAEVMMDLLNDDDAKKIPSKLIIPAKLK